MIFQHHTGVKVVQVRQTFLLSAALGVSVIRVLLNTDLPQRGFIRFNEITFYESRCIRKLDLALYLNYESCISSFFCSNTVLGAAVFQWACSNGCDISKDLGSNPAYDQYTFSPAIKLFCSQVKPQRQHLCISLIQLQPATSTGKATTKNTVWNDILTSRNFIHQNPLVSK